MMSRCNALMHNPWAAAGGHGMTCVGGGVGGRGGTSTVIPVAENAAAGRVKGGTYSPSSSSSRSEMGESPGG